MFALTWHFPLPYKLSLFPHLLVAVDLFYLPTESSSFSLILTSDHDLHITSDVGTGVSVPLIFTAPALRQQRESPGASLIATSHRIVNILVYL